MLECFEEISDGGGVWVGQTPLRENQYYCQGISGGHSKDRFFFGIPPFSSGRNQMHD